MAVKTARQAHFRRATSRVMPHLVEGCRLSMHPACIWPGHLSNCDTKYEHKRC